MSFKVETKPTYSIVCPEGEILDEALAKELQKKIESLLEEGVENFIVDLKLLSKMELEAGSVLLDLHQVLYEKEHSFVFTGLQEDILLRMKKEQLHLSLNLCPTLIEAIDIVSMEILERDILKEF